MTCAREMRGEEMGNRGNGGKIKKNNRMRGDNRGGAVNWGRK